MGTRFFPAKPVYESRSGYVAFKSGVQVQVFAEGEDPAQATPLQPVDANGDPVSLVTAAPYGRIPEFYVTSDRIGEGDQYLRLTVGGVVSDVRVGLAPGVEFATKGYVAGALADAAIGDIDLTGYATTEALAGKADAPPPGQQFVTTQQLTDGLAGVTVDTTGLATSAQLAAVVEQVEGKAAAPPQGQQYATTDALNNAIANIETPSGPGIAWYATKAEALASGNPEACYLAEMTVGGETVQVLALAVAAPVTPDPPQPVVIISDSFDTDHASNWGQDDLATGNEDRFWSPYPQTNASVSGGWATWGAIPASSGFAAHLPAASPVQDSDTLILLRSNVTPTAPVTLSVEARKAGDDVVQGQLRWASSGELSMRLRTYIAGASTVAADWQQVTAAATGVAHWARLRVETLDNGDTRITFKVWADGSAEPEVAPWVVTLPESMRVAKPVALNGYTSVAFDASVGSWVTHDIGAT